MTESSPADPGKPTCAECGSDHESVAWSMALGAYYCYWHYGEPPKETSRESSQETSEETPSEPVRLSGRLSGGEQSDPLSGGADGEVPLIDGIDKVRIRAQYLGIPGPDEDNGPCVLPHHDHPAGLIQGELGWAYYCEVCDETFTLPAVLAIQRYVKVPYGDRREESCKRQGWRDIRPPGRIEVMRWADHLDHLVGLAEPREVAIFLPDDLSESAKCLGAAIKLMLGLRDPEKWPENQDKFTCTRRFSRVMAGLSDDGAKFARQELERRKTIVRVGKTGFANIFRLGWMREVYPTGEKADDEASAAENALVEKFIEGFDAEEITAEGEAVDE